MSQQSSQEQQKYLDRSQVKTEGGNSGASADLQSMPKVFSEVQDMMKMSPSQQQLSNSPQLIAKSMKQNNIKTNIDYERSSPQINSNSKIGGYSSSINQILLEKETQNQKLREMNSMLKEKIQKLSQALDISLGNQRQLQLQLQQSNGNLNSNLPNSINQSQNSQQPSNQREALQNHIKLKDKEISHYSQIINTLKKQNDQLKQKLDHKEGFGRVLELEDKLKEADKKNQELLREVKSMQRIQMDQGKALERMVNEGEFPNKVKHLMEEIRQLKEKHKQSEEKMRRDDKNAMQLQDYLIKLEEQNRESKAKIKSFQQQFSSGKEQSVILNNDTQNTEPSQIINNISNILQSENTKNTKQQQLDNQSNNGGVVAYSDNAQLEELQRVNGILNRAREVMFKKTQYLKTKLEKRSVKYQQKIEMLNNKIAEQDKEIKLYQLKLKDIVKNNLNSISSQAYIEIEGMMQPKPLQNPNNKMAEQYNKMREISGKYSKLPLKPGFQGGRSNPIRLNHLSIDVNSNDYGNGVLQTNTSILKSDITGNNGNISNRNLNNYSVVNVKGSKSIDPTSKKLAKIPETTRRGPQNGKIQLNSLFQDNKLNSDQKQQQILDTLDTSNIDLQQDQITTDAYVLNSLQQQQQINKDNQNTANNRDKLLTTPPYKSQSSQQKSYLDQFQEDLNQLKQARQQLPIRDLDKETDELLARFQAQNQSYIEQSNQVIDKEFDKIFTDNSNGLGDISKINQDMLDDDNFNSYE
eukprot:403374576